MRTFLAALLTIALLALAVWLLRPEAEVVVVHPRTPATTPPAAVTSSSDTGPLEARLAELERRLADSQRQVVNLQIFVQRLEAAEPAPPPASPPGWAQGWLPLPPLHAPARSVQVRAGDFEADVRGRFGPASEVELRPDGSKALHYWHEGLRVELQPDGRVKEAVHHGSPCGVALDANGSTGAFSADGRWYRPSRWSSHGVAIGDSGVDVVRILGDPDGAYPDANGSYALHYAHLDAIFFIREPDFRVFKIRVGGGHPRPDANGNID